MLQNYFPIYFPHNLQGYSGQSEAIIATFHILTDSLFTCHPIIPGSIVRDTSSFFNLLEPEFYI